MSKWRLLIACMPAGVVGLIIRAWVIHTPLMRLTSDEAFTGLEAFQILHGRLVLVPDGNQYGATTEAYLLAPVLTFWTGVWPLRVLALLLSCVAAYALYRLALGFLGRAGAAIVALIGWTMSGAVVQLWSLLYMGYTTGFIAETAALALSVRAVRSSDHLARTAALGGLATGFAMWSHPMYGTVAVLAMIVPSVQRIRELRCWWLPLAAGVIVGVGPWIAYIVRFGLPHSPRPLTQTSYLGRIGKFVSGLVPRLVGLRTLTGDWVHPAGLAISVAVLVIIAFVAGLVVLVRRCGRPALPLLVTGVLAFPALALFAPLGYVADARYGLPFIPMILMGLGGWLRLLPARARNSPRLVATVPVVWAILACLPVLHQQTGWKFVDPNKPAKQVVAVLRQQHVHYLAGGYWGTYLSDYLDNGRLTVAPDYTVRLPDEARQVAAASPGDVAWIYRGDHRPARKPPVKRWKVLHTGSFRLYLPENRQ